MQRTRSRSSSIRRKMSFREKLSKAFDELDDAAACRLSRGSVSFISHTEDPGCAISPVFAFFKICNDLIEDADVEQPPLSPRSQELQYHDTV